jgi:hypothetical protein
MAPAELADALGADATADFVAVRATLATVRHGLSPILHSLSLQRSCPGGFR